VRVSMPGRKWAARRRACYVVRGASTQRQNWSRKWPVRVAVLPHGLEAFCGGQTVGSSGGRGIPAL
jgi:hypothetical protein